MASSTLRLKIVEGPATYIRARYECENRKTITLKGEHSTKRKSSFPKIQVKGYSGYEDLEIQVSCVAAKSTSLCNGRASYKAHPFELHGEDCYNGICRKSVGKINKMAVLSNIRILRVKVNAMHESLMLRQSMNADPYRQGFNHANNPASIDKKNIRLCFELYAKNGDQPLCEPIVSEVINCEKNTNDSLEIVYLSHKNAPVTGNVTLTICCNKLSKPSEITVRFSQKTPDGCILWEVCIHRNDIFVHEQAALVFQSPRYDGRLMANYEPIAAQIQIGYPSENKWSPPQDFSFTYEADWLYQIQTFPQYMSWTSSTVSTSTTENDVAIFDMQPSTSQAHFENYNADLNSNLNTNMIEYESEPMPGAWSYESQIPNLYHNEEIHAAMTVRDISSQNQSTEIVDIEQLSFIETLLYLLRE